MKSQGVAGLPAGTKLTTISGRTIEVVKKLGEGGQGIVYLVNYEKQQMALKWYKNSFLDNAPSKEKFYENIKANVVRKSPSREFLWPLDITGWSNGTFGYVMYLRPSGYYEVSDFLLSDVYFKNFKTMCDAALHIVSAFNILHMKGYAYQDLNDGNFFINPNTGDVLICDNDNVAPNGTNSGIIGKPRFIAPEVVVGNTKPNNYSDRFSMALILFMLLCHVHPLEGMRSLGVATPQMQMALYGTQPLFVMDKSDTSNRCHPQIHKGALQLWPLMPEYVKDLFYRSFTKGEGLDNVMRRPSEFEWLVGLARFRSDLVDCPKCKGEVFIRNGQTTACDDPRCKHVINIPFAVSNGRYTIPGIPGSRIYRCQVSICDIKDALNPVAVIVPNPKNPNLYGLRNLTDKTWAVTAPNGETRYVAPSEVAPLVKGLVVSVYDGKLSFI